MSSPYELLQQIPGALLPARSVAQLLPMTFLENLEIAADGTIVMTSMLDGRLWMLPPGGEPRLLAQVEGRAYSIAAAPDGGWLVFGTSVHGRVVVFKVTAEGRSSVIMEVPAGVFPNGVQRFPGGHYLLADSITATIWDIDYNAGVASAWYSHPLLAPVPGQWAPALNGLKVFEDTLYMTNSSANTLLAMPIANGRSAGEPRIAARDFGGDDFAIDRTGAIYMTTHPMDVVLRRDPNGRITRVAGPAEGVRGCTACRFGRAPGDETGLYVITDGGLFNPLSGGLKPAQVVRLETGVPGAPADLL
jgi:hypothetical protein